MKQHTIKTEAGAVRRGRRDSTGKILHVNKCLGLRPRPCGGLRPTAGMKRLSSNAQMRPLTSLNAGGKELTIFSTGTELWLRRGPLTGTAPLVRQLSPVLPAPAVCAAGGDGEATLMLEAEDGTRSCVRLATDGMTVRLLADPSGYPSLSLTSQGAGSYQAVMAPRTIPGESLSSMVPDRKTAAALCDDFADAYCHCAEAALGAGAYIQPALVRYRLLDARGRRLFESAPVLLSRDGLGQSSPSGYIERTLTPDGTAAAHTLSTDGWRPVLGIPAGFATAAPDVACVEVLVSEQFHPWHPDAAPAVTIAHRGDSKLVRVSLPGTGCGLTVITEEASRLRLTLAAARMDMIEHCAARIALSGGDTAARSITTAVCPPAAGVAGSVRRMDAALATRPQVPALPLLTWPNRLWARHVACDAGIIAWADLAGLRFGGYPPCSMAISRSAATGHWRMGVSVTFAGGTEKTVTEEEGTGNPPSLLSPVLCYPAADAVEMRVQLVHGTSTFDRRFALTPDPSGRIAIYISPGFAPVDLSQGKMKLFEVETSVNVAHAYADATAISSPDSPCEATAVARTGTGAPVTGIAATGSGNQAWDFGRHRFVLGSADGLYSLAVSHGRHSMRRIYPQGLQRGDALASAGSHGVYALLTGDGGSGGATLVNIASSGRVKILDSDAAGPFLQFLPGTERLITGAGSVFMPGSDMEYASPCLEGATGAFSCTSVPVLRGKGGGLYLPEEEEAEDGSTVDWQCTLDGPAARPRDIILDMASSHADLLVELRQDTLGSAATEAPVVCEARIHGSICGPLRLKPHGRRSSTARMRMRISGQVSQDFVFRTITLCHNDN